MIKIGIIGGPNKGKTTFFSAITLKDAKIANYPFTTIEPNRGIAYACVECVCKEFGVKCNPKNSICIDGVRLLPVEVIDVAGLVPDAHKGRGMGNKFLDDLRQASVLINVIDISGETNAQGEPTNDYDPINDVIFIEKEIDKWFFNIINRQVEKLKRKIVFEKRDPIRELASALSGLSVTEDDIRKAFSKNPIEKWTTGEVEQFAKTLREISKPIIIAANKIDKEGAEENFKRLKKELSDRIIIPTSAEAELALRKAHNAGIIEYYPWNGFKVLKELDDRQKQALSIIEKIFEKFGGTGVQECINRAIFDVLRYIVVFPVANERKLCDTQGNVLPDAFLVKEGTTVREFAYEIHSEIGKKFISAVDVRTGKFLAEDYVLKHRDVIKIVSGVQRHSLS